MGTVFWPGGELYPGYTQKFWGKKVYPGYRSPLPHSQLMAHPHKICSGGTVPQGNSVLSGGNFGPKIPVKGNVPSVPTPVPMYDSHYGVIIKPFLILKSEVDYG